MTLTPNGGPPGGGPDDDWVERTGYDKDTGQYYPFWGKLSRYEKAVRESWLAQLDRSNEFQDFVTKNFENVLRRAVLTYWIVTAMTALTFAVGVGLVLFGALYATLGDAAALSAVFAGLGVSTFVAVFVVKPLDDAQNALSNLIQADMAFMSFFEQIRMLASYAWKEGELDPAKAEKASVLLHRRTADSIELLQKYLEKKPRQGLDRDAAKQSRGGKQAADAKEPPVKV